MTYPSKPSDVLQGRTPHAMPVAPCAEAGLRSRSVSYRAPAVRRRACAERLVGRERYRFQRLLSKWPAIGLVSDFECIRDVLSAADRLMEGCRWRDQGKPCD